jgi:3-methyladenine DNA glycosylase AlkD
VVRSPFDARDVVADLDLAFRRAADPARAAPMRRYMNDQFPFLGLAAPPRRAAQAEVVAQYEAPAGDADLEALLRALWTQPEREFCYAGVDLVRRWIRVATPAFLEPLRWAITARSWWDTVDGLVPSAGALAHRSQEVVATLHRWNAEEDRWLVRVSILYQLGRKAGTDEARLFEHCAAQARHPDFFVRKAIGWALRDYARTAPTAVAAFVAAHPELSPLSRREALKHLRIG